MRIIQRDELVNIGNLLKGQKEMDKKLLTNAGRTYRDTQSEHEVELIVEIAEAAQEIEALWKYWKKNPRNNPGLLEEELADVLHLIISWGVCLKVSEYHPTITIYGQPSTHLAEFMKSAAQINGGFQSWTRCFSLFRGLLDLVNIEWDQIVEAFWKKQQTNFKRQRDHY